MEPLSCEQLLGHFSAYLEGDAAPELCARIEHHLAMCPNCHAVADTLRQTLRLAHELPPPALPAHVREHLQQALADFLPPR